MHDQQIDQNSMFTCNPGITQVSESQKADSFHLDAASLTILKKYKSNTKHWVTARTMTAMTGMQKTNNENLESQLPGNQRANIETDNHSS